MLKYNNEPLSAKHYKNMLGRRLATCDLLIKTATDYDLKYLKHKRKRLKKEFDSL